MGPNFTWILLDLDPVSSENARQETGLDMSILGSIWVTEQTSTHSQDLKQQYDI